MRIIRKKKSSKEQQKEAESKVPLEIKRIMLVPSDMIAAQSKMVYQMNKYCADRVQVRKAQIHKQIQEVCRIVQDVLKEVEVRSPGSSPL